MRDEYRSLYRLFFALALLLLGLFMIFRAMRFGFGLVALVMLIGGFFLWLLAAALVAPTVAGWFAAPWGGLFFPSARDEKPPPHYSLGEAMVQRDDFEGALAHYVQITLDYPEEVRPYCEMLDIILRHLDDPERAEVVYQKGMNTLQSQEAKEILARHYRAAKSRAAGRPEWGQVHTVGYKGDAKEGYRTAPDDHEHVPNPLRTSKPK
jgi:hypothetical protein